MIEVPNEQIFVAIAAYREPELRRTIDSCLRNAAEPGRLRFGVCLQYDRAGPPETQPDCLAGIAGDVEVISFDWTESKGGCWARHQVQSLYDGEGFTMQVDSHTRFAPNWDHDLVEMMRTAGVPKPLITAQLPLYDLTDGVDSIPDLEPVRVTVFEQISPAGWIWHPSVEGTEHLNAPRPTRAVSGMFVFTLGIWNNEVRQDPEHLYTGEELALSIRSFTHGYDLLNPTHNVAWHRHHPEGNLKFIHDGDDAEVSRRDERAYRRLRMLHRGDVNRVLQPYSTGSVRTVSEYHRWAGVDVGVWTLTDAAQRGLTPHAPAPAQ
ncbi:MAG: GlcNAc-transferase family protein [Ilumatobacter sp.]